MSDDLIRLSDLLPAYARYHALSLPEAAFGLQELIGEVCIEYMLRREDILPKQLFWVGRVVSSEVSIRGYELDEEGLLSYFEGLCNPLPGVDSNFIQCFCCSVNKRVCIPASIVYSSRETLGQWIGSAGIEASDFVSSSGMGSRAEADEGKAVLQSKELNSISLIIGGLVELIKEVDKAHTDQSPDEAVKKRSETIRRRVLGLRSDRKNFDPCTAIISLAEAAGVDMPKSHKTLKKYMGGWA
ncbi:hypothetical protein [Pseudomonas triticifolii]|uniref:Uncharacterized protein n=1 Tax=Pseudomonas triticifolii TaxID=2762592 RepID=A0ABR7BIV0_9PSED|nr:hypothetical protein [Pseudomonas triticifolii]MBC3957117.1 hypothetical protein [Pseudomonas triticifolii]